MLSSKSKLLFAFNKLRGVSIAFTNVMCQPI